MFLLRRLDTHHKLYASFALLLCLGAALSLWLLAQLAQLSASGGAARLHTGYAGARLVTAAAIGVTLAAAAVLALWLRADLARPLQAATAMAHRIAAGDLSSQIGLAAGAEAGQLCQAMQHMNDTLAAMVAKLRGGTEHIAANAGQIAAASMLQSARCDEQAAALAQAESALQQLEASMRMHADLATGLAGALTGVGAIRQAGGQVAQLAVEAATASTAMRAQAACLSRASAAFVLGPEHGVQAPAIHLVASNPHRLRTARALAPLVSVPQLARARAGRRDLDWNEF
jgi:methyl-accepting chemotaxis protein